MKQIFTVLAFLFFVSIGVQAQKVAFCGFNTDPNDGFAFVALTDLVEGDKIFFTDCPYVASTNSFDQSSGFDAVITYTVPTGGLPKGRVILAVETNAGDAFTVTRSGSSTPTGTVTVPSGSTFSLSGSEPLFAFRATNLSDPASAGSVAEIFGYVLMGGNASNLGDDPEADGDAPLSPEFVAIQHTSTNTDGGSYRTTGGLRNNTTLAQITNVSNWNTSNNNITISTTAFTNLSFGGFPVEWLDFKAVAGASGVTVSWITARELNNDYFVIENSLDGVEFSELGQVEGAGNSDAPISYQFVDASPKANTLYYRVRQVDFDGASSFTNVMMVNMGVVSGNVKMYPNPVVNDLTVDQFQGVMTIYNVAGQKMSRTSINGSKTIDLSGLEKGIYLVRLVSNTGVAETHRIVK